MLKLPGVGFISGAASGIGRATSIVFATAGARALILCDRNEKGLKETRDIIKRDFPNTKISTFQMDVTNDSEVRSIIQSGAKEHGRLDYAVNCAGVVGPIAPTGETSV
jgi:NAD(P)-dependent dehydrogenase (short-subunit alcohol dehydrogenase family)